jgi:membrane protein required for colicin V production
VNWLDFLLIAVLAFSTFRSFTRGFSREIIGLAAALIALLLGMWFYGLAGSFVAPHVGSARMANLIGFLIIVGAVLFAGSIGAWIVNRFLKVVGLSFFDQVLGAIFGLLRGLLIAIALITGYTAFGPWAENRAAPDAVVHSQIAPYILDASHYVVAVAPMDLKQNFGNEYLKIESALENSVRGKRAPDDQTGKPESK